MSPDELKQFESWGVPLPERKAHGTDDDIRQNLTSSNPRNWRQEGNRLIAETDLGELSQTIPVDYILTGTDKQGNPEFKKV